MNYRYNFFNNLNDILIFSNFNIYLIFYLLIFHEIYPKLIPPSNSLLHSL